MVVFSQADNLKILCALSFAFSMNYNTRLTYEKFESCKHRYVFH
jgi:hypothetical protein